MRSGSTKQFSTAPSNFDCFFVIRRQKFKIVLHLHSPGNTRPEKEEKAIPITCGQFKKTAVNFATSRTSEIEWTTSQTFNHFPFCQSSSDPCRQNPSASRGFKCFRPSVVRTLSRRDARVKDVSPARRDPHEQEGEGVASEGENPPSICFEGFSLQCQLHNEPFTMFCTTKKTMLCMKCFRWEIEKPIHLIFIGFEKI